MHIDPLLVYYTITLHYFFHLQQKDCFHSMLCDSTKQKKKGSYQSEISTGHMYTPIEVHTP